MAMRLTQEQVDELACNMELDDMANHLDVLIQASRNAFNRVLFSKGGKIECRFPLPTPDNFGLSSLAQDNIIGAELDDDGVITIYTDGVPEIPLDMFYVEEQLYILEHLIRL